MGAVQLQSIPITVAVVLFLSRICAVFLMWSGYPVADQFGEVCAEFPESAMFESWQSLGGLYLR